MTSDGDAAISGPAGTVGAIILLLLGFFLTTDALMRSHRPSPEADDFAALAWRIDLNTATEHELTLLPRIGPTLAARIVADRDSLGPFASVDELLRIRGIGLRTLDGLAEEALARPITITPEP